MDSAQLHARYRAGKHMTEIKLNECLEQIELLQIDRLPSALNRKTGRQYRRDRTVGKNDRLMKIVRGRYIPHAGCVDCGFTGNTLLYSSIYIKYPKNSNCQRWIKRTTSRKMRC